MPIVYYDKVLGNFIHSLGVESYNEVNMIEYQIKDYDTPENICYRLYNDSSLSWILLYLNNIIDPFYDWPLNTNELRKYIIDKYGIENMDKPHHYLDKNGKIVNKDSPDVYSTITNEQYETLLNDEKRAILIPNADVMSSFLNSLENINE
jgi:hypothetical protein